MREVLVDFIDYGSYFNLDDMISMQNLVQMIRRERLKYAPPNVRELNFEMYYEHILEDYYKGEVVTKGARHIILLA